MVLFALNKGMKAKDGKRPNRFLAWAGIGIIGAPLSIALFSSTMATDVSTGRQQVVRRDPSASSSPVEVQAQSQPVAKTSSQIPLGVEEQIRSDRSLKVTGSETYSKISANNSFGFAEPVTPKGGKLIAVFMTIKNTGNESGNAFWSQFQLEDSQKRIYDKIEDFKETVTINMWADGRGLAEAGDQIFPGGTSETVAVFRVAPDAEGLVLVVNEDKRFAIN